MIGDHTHIITKNRDIFTVRGFNFDKKIFGVPIYFKTESNNLGCRIYKNTLYEKFIDEYAERYFNLYPKLVVKTNYGIRIKIPERNILKTFDPFSNFSKIYNNINKKIYKKIIDGLKIFISPKDIGFIGSRLIGFSTKDSDLDIVIRGMDNYQAIKSNFKKYLSCIGAQSAITQQQYDKSIKKYEYLFNKKYNDFGCMILNRWPTVYIPHKVFYKLRFTYNPQKDDFFRAPQINNLKEGQLAGKVIEDIGVAFMPRRFKILNSVGKIYTIITYFWDFSYCVSTGDQVNIKGSIDYNKNIIVIKDRRNHGIKFISQPFSHCPII